jgi:hypothetical protein
MTMHDQLKLSTDPSEPSDDEAWTDLAEEPDLDDLEAWDELDDADDNVDVSALDELFGPWIGDEELVAGPAWRSTVPRRGFYRD